MRILLINIGSLLGFLLIGSIVCAQQKDFVTMPQLAIRYKFNSSCYTEAFQQFMFSDNSRELWMSSSDIGFGFRISSSLATEVHYRNVNIRRLNNQFENRNLFYHTISFQENIGKFLFSIRNRVQQLTFSEHFNDDYRTPRWYDRVRFNISRRVDYYWSGAVNCEFFYPLNNSERSGLDQYRLGAAVTRRFNESFSTALSYQLQQQVGRTGNNAYFVLGIQINYEL
ncbi:MAG: hypothetical protein RL204_537 [Bacteroidota bacterium]|jgi:hypothetical protein